MNIVKNGVYPAMLTPFDEKGAVDYGAVRELTEWYIEKKCAGVFATCLSSEIFLLSAQENYQIAKTVLETAGDRMDVVISGHVEDDFAEQLKSLRRNASLGAKSLVLISNRLAKPEESDDVLKRNITKILEEIPDVSFGMYECPVPYSRFLSPELIRWCADTGRINFMKDTCCTVKEIVPKLEAAKGTGFKIFNANSVTLLESLKAGAAGMCGVMGNFHPDLYAKLIGLYPEQPEKAQKLQDILGVHSMINYSQYPMTAKYYLTLEGLHFKSLMMRREPDFELPDTAILEMQQRFANTQYIRRNLEAILNG